MSDAICDLWSMQDGNPGPRDPAELAAAEAAWRQAIARRDRREYIAGAVVVLVFVLAALLAPTRGIALGASLVVIGVGIVLVNLRRHRPTAPDPALGLAGHQFLRAQLVAQRDTLAGVWRWYLLPLVPGLSWFVLATAWPHIARQAVLPALLSAALALLPFALVFLAIFWSNRRAARRIEQQIAVLDQAAS